MKSNSFNPTEEIRKTFNITEDMLKYADKQCLCPFCFGKFTPLTSAFRIAPESVCSKMHYDTLAPEEKEAALPYREANDVIYEDFWKRFPGSEPSDVESKTISRRPVMHMLLENCLRGRFGADKDGFPAEMTDSKGNKSDIRICPHCHNQLPLNFGKHPIKYIAIVGITSSGKTVYLSQFLKGLYDNLTDIGFVQVDGMNDAEKFWKLNLVKKGNGLPMGNATDKLTLPIAITIQNERIKNKIYTLVFYDIAGENCVNSDQMKKYGSFIVNADGIIMIVDPDQFPGMLSGTDDIEDDTINPGKVLQAMYHAFVAAKTKEGQCDVPLAVAVSKSDLLRADYKYRNYQSNIFQNIDYSKYRPKGFPYDDYLNITTEVQNLLEKERTGKTFVSAVKNGFVKNDFFAFTALNVKPIEKKNKDIDGAVYYVLEEDPETIRIEESFNWLLYQMGILEKAEKSKSGKEGPKPKKFLGIFGKSQ